MENLETKIDTRNLQDEYKGMPNEQVFAELDKKRSALEVAIENVEHDFNVGTIVRSANNFNAAKVHIIGKKKYNRRGAMCTDKYLEVVYWTDVESFYADQLGRGREVVAIENNDSRVRPLAAMTSGSVSFCPVSSYLSFSPSRRVSIELSAILFGF